MKYNSFKLFKNIFFKSDFPAYVLRFVKSERVSFLKNVDTHI